MAVLTATSWTVTIDKQIIKGKQREHRCKIVSVAGNVITGGFPGPTRAALGLRKFLDHMVVLDTDDGNALPWKYDQANHKFRIQGLIALSSAVAIATGNSFEFNLASGRTTIGSTGAAVTLTGNLGEMASGVSVGAQTFYVVAYGW